MTTETSADDQATDRAETTTPLPVKTQHNKSKRKGPKPATQWLKTVLAPHRSGLRVKALLDVAAGLMAIPIAACLAGGVHALIVAKGGMAGLWPFALGLFVSIVIRAALGFMAGRKGHRISADIRHSLRLQLARTLANHPPLDIERRSAGEIAALGSDVTEALDAYTSRYLSLQLQLLVIPIAIAVAVASYSWAVALILMLCGPMIPVAMAIVGLRAKKAADAQVSALSDMSARFLDRLSGMTTLRLFRAVGRTRMEFDHLANDYRRATMRVLRIVFLSSAALELFAALGIALTAIYVAYHLLGYSDFGSYGVPITLGPGLFLVMLAPDFFAPLREFSVAYHDKATAESAAERLMQLLPVDRLSAQAGAHDAQPAGDDDDPVTDHTIETIRFEQCALGYGDARGTVLNDVSFSLREGEKIAILGSSGSGKSTLLAALCGFLQPTEGRLTFDGQEAPSDHTGWDQLRRAMAWIGQKPHIFHGSVLMNTRLAAPDASRSEVRTALELAHADHFVAQLPRDLLTILGETGFGVSGGQIRRLAIARAALSHASLVICDEPTADLDASTAANITDSLMQMAKGSILVVATHDRAVAEQCDRILYVHEGRVTELSHGDLPNLGGEKQKEMDATTSEFGGTDA